MNDIIDLSNEFTISFLTDEEETNIKNELEELTSQLGKTQTKLDKIYENMISFIRKLKSNPEATTIKWPDRIKDIDKFEAQLYKIYIGK